MVAEAVPESGKPYSPVPHRDEVEYADVFVMLSMFGVNEV